MDNMLEELGKQLEAINPELKARIDKMSREDMAHAWRFAPSGDPMFTPPAGHYLQARFQSLGGMNPEISKKLGWD